MKANRNLLRWLWPFFTPHKGTLFVVFVLAMLNTILDLSFPYLSKILIDDVLVQPTYSLETIVLLILALTILGIVLNNLNSYIYLNVTLKIVKKIRLHVFDRIERLPHGFFVRTKVGELTNRLNTDINVVQSTLTDGSLQFVMSLLTFIFIAVMLFQLNWQLTLISFIVFPFLVGCLLYFRPTLMKLTHEIRQNQGNIQSHMIETFSYIRSIKLLQAEEERTDILGVKINTLNHVSLRYAVTEILAVGIPRIVIVAVTTFILFIGGLKVLEGTLTVGSLFAFTAYLNRFFSPVQTLSGLYLRFQKMFVSLRRITEFLNLQQEDYNMESESEQTGGTAVLVLRHVNKKLENGRVLFRDMNVTLQGNCSYALVGPSGIGKSTFADMLVRLSNPSNGSIQFHGRDIKDISVKELRKRIVVIPQEVEMIHHTIRENLLLGLPPEKRKSVTDRDITSVCQSVGLHEYIKTLPHQYDTVMGEKGKMFSGGQKQRIAIARGLLRNPDVLILDEATSGLDLAAEKSLFTMLDEWRKENDNRMLIIISHRLSSLDWIERYLFIEDGTIVEKKALPA